MRRKPRTAFLLSFFAILLFAVSSFLHLSNDAVSHWRPNSFSDYRPRKFNLVVHDILSRQTRRISSIKESLSTVSVLLPDWEILVIVSPNTPLSSSDDDDDDQYHCLFQNGAVSPARHSGVLPFTNRTTFKCFLPESVRRRRMFSQPVLVTSLSENESPEISPPPELMKWNFLVYESFSTENDVVLFAKGVNHRQGYDRSPTELRCVFHLSNGNGNGNVVRKAVTSSTQEVFRCPHPDPSELSLLNSERFGISISLEIVTENVVVPVRQTAIRVKKNIVSPCPTNNATAKLHYETCRRNSRSQVVSECSRNPGGKKSADQMPPQKGPGKVIESISRSTRGLSVGCNVLAMLHHKIGH